MKRVFKLTTVVLCMILLCGCGDILPQDTTIDVDKILTGVVESIDWEEMQGYAEKGADALIDKFPALKTLTDQEKVQQILRDSGLKLLGKYIESTDPEVQEDAAKLGEILKILNPELTDEVDAVLKP